MQAASKWVTTHRVSSVTLALQVGHKSEAGLVGRVLGSDLRSFLCHRPLWVPLACSLYLEWDKDASVVCIELE